MFGRRNIRQQINTLTAFIDAGQVYGADDVKARLLRDLSSDRGLLKVNAEHTDNGRELLPFTTMNANMCATRGHITNDSNAREVPCFLAGESLLPQWHTEFFLFQSKVVCVAHLKQPPLSKVLHRVNNTQRQFKNNIKFKSYIKHQTR